MSILDEANISKNHDDVQSSFIDQVDVEETFENMLIIRVKMRVPIDDYKSSMDKGRLIRRYYEDVISAQDIFRCTKTTFMVNVNSIANIVCTTSIYIGWNIHLTDFEVMKFLVLISTASLYFKPEQDDVVITLKELNGYGEPNRLSIKKLFTYEASTFILHKFKTKRTNMALSIKRRFVRTYKTIEKYFKKHNLKNDHYVQILEYME